MWPFKTRQRPVIPKFHNQEPRHVEIRVPDPKPPAIEVDEVDTSAMTQTGIHRIWQKWKGEK